MSKTNLWLKYNENEITKIFSFAEQYRNFISKCKTERECITEIINKARQKGFISLEELKEKKSLTKGDKIYVTNMNKAIVLFKVGEESLENGMNVLGAHLDSPRLDIIPNPLYEEANFAYLDTHYYGGIKKYQWLALPLALHGVVIKKDGTKIELKIGENETDPVIGITDLLPHLANEQLKKQASEFIDPENLDIMIGSIPLKLTTETEQPVKDYILKILKDQYDFEEQDFLSAEIEIVPAGKARDFGLDRSMIIGYGQDDRSCSYASLEAILNIENNKKTCVCLLVDKEEIGSYGATGMQSSFFYNVVAELLELEQKSSLVSLHKSLNNSKVLSCDVTCAYDPLYSEVMNQKTISYLNKGVTFNKYTGSKGKSGSSDANAEYIAKIRKVLDEANLTYQISEMGKIDRGGGGTIAYMLANHNMEVIDCGISVLSMHAPYEVISKADLYEAYQTYLTFLKNI